MNIQIHAERKTIKRIKQLKNFKYKVKKNQCLPLSYKINFSIFSCFPFVIVLYFVILFVYLDFLLAVVP